MPDHPPAPQSSLEDFDTKALPLAWAVLVVHAAYLAWVYPSLPEKYPTHFGINGAPDAWSDTGFFSVWMLVVLNAVFLAFFSWAPSAEFLMKHKRQYDLSKLTPEGRVDIERHARQLFREMSLVLTLFFATISVGGVRVALGAATTLPFFLFIPFLALLLLVVGIRSFQLNRAARNAGIVRERRLGG